VDLPEKVEALLEIIEVELLLILAVLRILAVAEEAVIKPVRQELSTLAELVVLVSF
jgi:hypothetical protein